MLVGVSGYSILEDYSLLDSIFMTVITVATVGYREVRDLDAAGKIFTSLLIIFSIGTFAYSMSVITHYVIEENFNRILNIIR
jgi:voltage-gated potassium channel